MRSCRYFRACPGTRTSQVLSGSQDRPKYAHARPGDTTTLHSLLRVIEACISVSIAAYTALHSLTAVASAGVHLGLGSHNGAPLSHSFSPPKHIPSRIGHIRPREAHTGGHCICGWPFGIVDASLLPWMIVGGYRCRPCSSPPYYLTPSLVSRREGVYKMVHLPQNSLLCATLSLSALKMRLTIFASVMSCAIPVLSQQIYDVVRVSVLCVSAFMPDKSCSGRRPGTGLSCSRTRTCTRTRCSSRHPGRSALQTSCSATPIHINLSGVLAHL